MKKNTIVNEQKLKKRKEEEAIMISWEKKSFFKSEK